MAELGHVVFYVRDLEASLPFYLDVVGLDLVGRILNGKGALLSGGGTTTSYFFCKWEMRQAR